MKNERMETFVNSLTEQETWQLRQILAGPGGRYYGDGGTIHATEALDVIVRGGNVVAVWFRCQMLPFKQCKPGAGEGNPIDKGLHITGVNLWTTEALRNEMK